jgi:hypothetical protein
VLLIFKAFWDTGPFGLVVIYGLSEKFVLSSKHQKLLSKSTAELPKIIELSS